MAISTEILKVGKPGPVETKPVITAYFNKFTSAEEAYDPKEIAERHMERRKGWTTSPSVNSETTLKIGMEQPIAKIKLNGATPKK